MKRKNQHEPLGLAYFGLLLFMIVYFARPEDWIQGLTRAPLAKLAGVVILAAVVLSVHNIRWDIPKEIILLGLLVTQLWLTVPFSPVWRGGAFNEMLDFSKVLPLVLVIWWTVRSSKRFRRVVFVQAAAVAAIAIASIVNAHAPGARLQGVLSGMYGNSNDLALAIDIALPLCLAIALTTRGTWKKAAWAATMLAMIYAVFLTASRAGAIALFIAGLVCLWQLGVKGRRVYLFLLVPLTVIVIWLYSGNALRQRFGQTVVDPANNNSRTEASESAQQRRELLFKSLKVTAEHPLFGIGPGNFAVVSGVWHVTHNSYTQMSAEGGVPAFCLYIFIFWRAIANLGEVRKYGKTGYSSRLFAMALEASLAAYLVGSFFASLTYLFFPYCLVAYTSALRLVVRRDATSSNQAQRSVTTPGEMEATVWQ